MVTLRQAHSAASAYWDTKRGTTGKVMAMRATKAVTLGGLGWDRKVSSLTAGDATSVLTGLRRLALSSRASYYLAFKRMCGLAGHSCMGWPSAGAAPRRVREPLTREDAKRLHTWFTAQGMGETADLLTVLLGTGMRVEVEALSFDAWTWHGLNHLHITGKGGHHRIIPVQGNTVAVMKAERMNAMRRLSYGAHLKRWNRGVQALGIRSKLPTPHAVRHLYATEAYARCKNLNVVKELLGHADINTTARYIGVDQGELRHAAGC